MRIEVPTSTLRSIKSSTTKNWLALVQICVAASLVLLGFIFLSSVTPLNDVIYYGKVYTKLITGDIPYRDFFLEYPLGFTLLLYPAKLLSITAHHFPLFYRSLTITATLLSFFSLYKMVQDHLSKSEFVTKAFLIVLCFSPLFLSFYDIFPILMTILAVQFLLKGRYNTSFVFLGLGTLLKYYPLVLTLPFTLYLLRRGVRLKKILLAASSLFLILILFSAIGIITMGWDSITLPIKFYLERGLHVEAALPAVLALSPKFDIFSPAPPWIGSAAFLIAFFTLGAYLLSSFRELVVQSNSKIVAKNSLLILLITILTSKVFSPQLLLWIFPFVFLLYAYTKEPWIFWVYALTLILTVLFLLNPIYISLSIEGGHLPGAILINARNAVLIVYTICIWRKGRQDPAFTNFNRNKARLPTVK